MALENIVQKKKQNQKKKQLLIITTIISCVICVIPMFFYDLKEKDHQKIIEDLKVRADEN